MKDHEENAPCTNPVEFGFFNLILAIFTNVFFNRVITYLILEPQMITFKFTSKNNEYMQIIPSFLLNHQKTLFF